MKNRQSAFTLIETMVSVAILALIVAIIYGTFFSVMNATQTGTSAAEQVQRERVALKTIEAALSGIVYYEQNQQHYAFTADTTDFSYPAISFVSRVPPGFLDSKAFGDQTLRRITFKVEDDSDHGKSLVMYQPTVLQPEENLGLGEEESGIRSVLGPGLDTFFVLFWSTALNPPDWSSEWTQTNSVPARIKFEMTFKRDDDEYAEITDTHKREIVIFSDSISQAEQSPPLPRSSGQGRGTSRGSSRSRFTPEQIAEWRKRQSQSRSSGSSSGRSSSRSMYSDAQRAAFRKRMAELARNRGQQSGGGRSFYPGGGQGSTTPGGGQTGNPGNPGSGGSTPGPGGGGGIPGQNVVNDALQFYYESTGQAATSISDLTDNGIVLPDPPPGTQWAIDPNNPARAIITPL